MSLSKLKFRHLKYLPTAIGLLDMARKRPYPKRRKPSKTTTSRRRIRKLRRPSNHIYIKPTKRRRLNFVRKNVKADVDGKSYTIKRQKLTRQQKRKIRKRFKQGYSSFTDKYETGIQDTMPQNTNSCKWIWRCHQNLSRISEIINKFPEDTVAPHTTTSGDYNVNAETQQVFFGKCKVKYEIVNPTNYDMNVTIYDLVCKEDTDRGCDNFASTSRQGNTGTQSASLDNPIMQMYTSTNNVQGFANTSSASASTVVADPTDQNIWDIDFYPTQAYKFNIYWNVVGKKTLKLQPGATHIHTFVYSPRCLISKGYYGYKYKYKIDDNTASEYFSGVKNFTCGSLFKVWGGVAGTAASAYSSGTDNTEPNNVVSLSGRIQMKEWKQLNYYYMNSKYRYVKKQYLNKYTPTDEEKLPISTENIISHPEDDISEDNVYD